MKQKIRGRNGWEFDPKTDGFKTTGDSMTVPDDNYTVQEILDRFTRGIPLNLGHPYYTETNEEEDHDDIDLEKFNHLDITEKVEILENEQDKIEENKRKKQAQKKPPENEGKTPEKDAQKS